VPPPVQAALVVMYAIFPVLETRKFINIPCVGSVRISVPATV
jgi:hypothetical protein